MQEYEIDLAIGDLVHIGNYVITLVDIDGHDISFRIDEDDAEDSILAHAMAETRHPK